MAYKSNDMIMYVWWCDTLGDENPKTKTSTAKLWGGSRSWPGWQNTVLNWPQAFQHFEISAGKTNRQGCPRREGLDSTCDSCEELHGWNGNDDKKAEWTLETDISCLRTPARRSIDPNSESGRRKIKRDLHLTPETIFNERQRLQYQQHVTTVIILRSCCETWGTSVTTEQTPPSSTEVSECGKSWGEKKQVGET